MAGQALTLAVDVVATYRLTRLATADTITDGPRDAIVRWAYRRAGREAIEQPCPDLPGAWSEVAMADDDPPKLATLVTCRWCAGMWIAAGVVLAREVAPELWRPLARTLLFSTAAALLANLED